MLAQQQRLAVIFGQPLHGLDQRRLLLVRHSLLARRGVVRGQMQSHCRADGAVQCLLLADPPRGRLAVLATEVGQIVQQDAPQPGKQFVEACPLKAGNVAMGFKKTLLHQVRGPSLGPQIRIELAVGDQQQVGPALFQQFAQRLLRSLFHCLQQVCGSVTFYKGDRMLYQS